MSCNERQQKRYTVREQPQLWTLRISKLVFFSMFRKRVGWLAVLCIGEMFTATAMGYYENELQRAVVQALFIPLIISSGGNPSLHPGRSCFSLG